MTTGSKHDRTIEQEYAARFPQSQQLHREAAAHLPGGVTHMARAFEPFPIYVDRCVGPYKWDVDGNRYIDFWTGHGAMLLGHAHPAVVEAIQEQAARGTHAGGSTQREIEWAQLIMDMVPCAESVKFTSSGTEATLLALRAARAATGKSKVHLSALQCHNRLASWSRSTCRCRPVSRRRCRTRSSWCRSTTPRP